MTRGKQPTCQYPMLLECIEDLSSKQSRTVVSSMYTSARSGRWPSSRRYAKYRYLCQVIDRIPGGLRATGTACGDIVTQQLLCQLSPGPFPPSHSPWPFEGWMPGELPAIHRLSTRGQGSGGPQAALRGEGILPELRPPESPLRGPSDAQSICLGEVDPSPKLRGSRTRVFIMAVRGLIAIRSNQGSLTTLISFSFIWAAQLGKSWLLLYRKKYWLATKYETWEGYCQWLAVIRLTHVYSADKGAGASVARRNAFCFCEKSHRKEKLTHGLAPVLLQLLQIIVKWSRDS